MFKNLVIAAGFFAVTAGLASLPVQAQPLNGVETVAALRASAHADRTLQLKGYNANFDGGEGTLTYDASDISTADNGCTVFVDAAGHRYKREKFGSYIFVQMCGAYGDGTHDDAPAAQRLVRALEADGGGVGVFQTARSYRFNSTVIVDPALWTARRGAPIQLNLQGADFIAPAGSRLIDVRSNSWGSPAPNWWATVTIDGGGANIQGNPTSPAAIRFTEFQRGQIRDLACHNFTAGACVELYNGDAKRWTENTLLSRLRGNNNRYGIQIHSLGSADVSFNATRIEYCEFNVPNDALAYGFYVSGNMDRSVFLNDGGWLDGNAKGTMWWIDGEFPNSTMISPWVDGVFGYANSGTRTMAFGSAYVPNAQGRDADTSTALTIIGGTYAQSAQSQFPLPPGSEHAVVNIGATQQLGHSWLENPGSISLPPGLSPGRRRYASIEATQDVKAILYFPSGMPGSVQENAIALRSPYPIVNIGLAVWTGDSNAAPRPGTTPGGTLIGSVLNAGSVVIGNITSTGGAYNNGVVHIARNPGGTATGVVAFVRIEYEAMAN